MKTLTHNTGGHTPASARALAAAGTPAHAGSYPVTSLVRPMTTTRPVNTCIPVQFVEAAWLTQHAFDKLDHSQRERPI